MVILVMISSVKAFPIQYCASIEGSKRLAEHRQHAPSEQAAWSSFGDWWSCASLVKGDEATEKPARTKMKRRKVITPNGSRRLAREPGIAGCLRKLCITSINTVAQTR